MSVIGTEQTYCCQLRSEVVALWMHKDTCKSAEVTYRCVLKPPRLWRKWIVHSKAYKEVNQDL